MYNTSTDFALIGFKGQTLNFTAVLGRLSCIVRKKSSPYELFIVRGLNYTGIVFSSFKVLQYTNSLAASIADVWCGVCTPPSNVFLRFYSTKVYFTTMQLFLAVVGIGDV